jgi:hypothetical protein
LNSTLRVARRRFSTAIITGPHRTIGRNRAHGFRWIAFVVLNVEIDARWPMERAFVSLFGCGHSMVARRRETQLAVFE